MVVVHELGHMWWYMLGHMVMLHELGHMVVVHELGHMVVVHELGGGGGGVTCHH